MNGGVPRGTQSYRTMIEFPQFLPYHHGMRSQLHAQRYAEIILARIQTHWPTSDPRGTP